MGFCGISKLADTFHGKRVAIIGSAPSVLDNTPGFVDGHDVVVRVNNYKTGAAQGHRCDVHYSFYGTSIKKPVEDLLADGVKLCMCKLPDSKLFESEWHRKHNKPHGVDYRYIYELRRDWWFCDTFVPDDARFLRKFDLLAGHQPTTGFAAILDVLEMQPAELYLTGFDFFTSGVHNVDEYWCEKNLDDPICHRPDLEMQWLEQSERNYPLRFDEKMTSMLRAMIPA